MEDHGQSWKLAATALRKSARFGGIHQPFDQSSLMETAKMDVAGFLKNLDELFELEPGTLNFSSVLEETPGWSSLTFLGLIALIDDCYQVTLKPRQVHQCATIGDIYEMVEEHSSAVT